MKRKVVIEIRGGSLQAVYSDADITVVLVDHDNIQQGDEPGEIPTSKLTDIGVEVLDLIYDSGLDFPSLPWPYADARPEPQP